MEAGRKKIKAYSCVIDSSGSEFFIQMARSSGSGNKGRDDGILEDGKARTSTGNDRLGSIKLDKISVAGSTGFEVGPLGLEWAPNIVSSLPPLS